MISSNFPATTTKDLIDQITDPEWRAEWARLFPGKTPAAFWDFDGTLIQGDCAEGFQPFPGVDVTGLVEAAIDAGFSKVYRPGGFPQCRKDYDTLLEEKGKSAAYAHFTTIFAGAAAAALTALAEETFARSLAAWLFPDALSIWRELEAIGVQNHVISATAEFFVQGAAKTLDVSQSQIHGMKLAATPEGILASEMVEPLTIGEGKAILLRDLASECNLLPIAAFGNDASSDGPMLETVASGAVPGLQPVAVLINQARPPQNARWLELKFPARATLPNPV